VNLPIGAKLLGVGAGVPSAIVTNADLEKLVETSDEWITSRTGIRERRIVGDDETASGLAIEAAKDAIGFANIDPGSIDLIIVATSTPDFLYPSTACIVQSAIGAPRAAAFDLEAACTGIIYALAVAQQFIGSGTFRTALIVGVDIHSRFLNWEDRNTCILFGDGAGAFILQASEDENEILATYLRADGNGAHLLKIPNTGTAYPHGGVTPPKSADKFLSMSGRPIYEFAVQAVPEAVRAAAAKAGIRVEDIDYLVPHQANRRIINAAAERLGMGKEKIVSNVEELGNTSAASIPLALWQAIKRKQVVPPATMALVGFGGGLTWGSAIVRWTAKDARHDTRPAGKEDKH
jgi:3-oxoacyl-[acyl-carrier-protein] synthase-3